MSLMHGLLIVAIPASSTLWLTEWMVMSHGHSSLSCVRAPWYFPTFTSTPICCCTDQTCTIFWNAKFHLCQGTVVYGILIDCGSLPPKWAISARDVAKQHGRPPLLIRTRSKSILLPVLGACEPSERTDMESMADEMNEFLCCLSILICL